ncbi:MAG: LysR family hydrogen peroxide-inducible transcriptional activator [Flavobacteriales bacterium]|jgi:LysR family hydrogen peroxide-inducible transcriptional activator|tara:strand:- start:24 stop:968 length:945 start_codon:yes stop_codon:yes gene_type:complete
MTITQLNYIIAVDTHRHFARAAESCFVTQPTLSMQIHKLEEELGVTIFDRSRKPLQPTDIGVQILEQARIIITEERRIEEIIQLHKGEISGDFKLAIIPTVASTLLPRFLKCFISQYPKVNLQIEELQTKVILERLKNGLLDAAILATPLSQDGIMEKPLYYEPFMAYTPMDHRLFKEKFLDNSDLDVNDILLLHEGHCFRDSVINLCSSLFDEKDKAGVKLESGSFETLIKLSKQGFGMTLVPYLKAIELKNIEPEGTVKPFSRPQPMREISLIHHRTHLKISIIEALAKCIQETIPEHMLKNDEGKVISPYK